MDVGATVKDLAVALGNKLGTDASVIVVICRGAVLKDLGAPLRAAAAAGFGEDGVLSIVFMARGPKAAVAPNAAPVHRLPPQPKTAAEAEVWIPAVLARISKPSGLSISVAFDLLPDMALSRILTVENTERFLLQWGDNDIVNGSDF